MHSLDYIGSSLCGVRALCKYNATNIVLSKVWRDIYVGRYLYSARIGLVLFRLIRIFSDNKTIGIGEGPMEKLKKKRYTSKQLRTRYDFVNTVATLLAKAKKLKITKKEYSIPCEGYDGCCFYSGEYDCDECRLANAIYERTRKRR